MKLKTSCCQTSYLGKIGDCKKGKIRFESLCLGFKVDTLPDKNDEKPKPDPKIGYS